MLLHWDGKYQVGVKVIDEQHRRLVEQLMQQHAYGRFAGAATA